MADRARLDVESAHRDRSAGPAVVVCAYADEAKGQHLHVASVPKDKELIFYCG